MSNTQTYLKKIGFDVFAIQSDSRLVDHILTFNPDLMIIYGKQKFSSVEVSQKLKEYGKYHGKVVLVVPNGVRPDVAALAKARMDSILEAPIQPAKLIQTIAKLLGLDAQPLLEKYSKAQFSESTESEDVNVSSRASSVSVHESIKIEDKDRVAKYQKFVQGMSIDKTQSTHTRQAIREKQVEMKKDYDFDLLDKLDKLKRQFVSALFKKSN